MKEKRREEKKDETRDAFVAKCLKPEKTAR